LPLKKHSEEEQEARMLAIEWTRKAISIDNQAFLRSLPRQLHLRFQVNNAPFNILLAHGSTRSNDEYIYEDHAQHDLLDMLNSSNSNVLIVGHTHLSFIRHIKDLNSTKTIINAGSAGRTKEADRLATYLMIQIDEVSIEYQFMKIHYDVQETISGIRQNEIPDFYARFLMK
jgi:predicted phosphodiesterase